MNESNTCRSNTIYAHNFTHNDGQIPSFRYCHVFLMWCFSLLYSLLLTYRLLSMRSLFRLYSFKARPDHLSALFSPALLMCSCLSLSICDVQANSLLASDEYTTEKRAVTAEQIVTGLNHPWSIAFISDNDWLITERSGTLRRVIDGNLQEQPITGLPEINPVGQGGLLDVVLHPEFDKNQWVYLSYSAKKLLGYGTEVARGKLVENELQNVETVFKATPKVLGGRHFGSRLVFDDNGFLYISLGDRGSKKTAQQQNKHLGTIIRLHDDGRIPKDNPFVDVANVLPEIYSYGHRNVQGMVFDNQTKTLWAHEHGPQGGDELNQVLAGQNYGWPTITYGANYGTGTKIGEGTDKPGMLQPKTYWDPSIAPSGLAIVDSPRYSEWQGNLLVGALKFQLIARLELDENSVTHEEQMLAGKLGRIRDIRQGPDGFIYLLTDSDNGSIYRLR